LLTETSFAKSFCSIPGKYAVERYPALKYVPSIFAPWKAQVLEQRKKDIQMYTGLMNDVKKRMAAGTLPNCFAKHLLDEQHNLGMTDLEVAYTAGTPFGAGVETVRPPGLFFFFFLEQLLTPPSQQAP
jgi:hypothetical protein